MCNKPVESIERELDEKLQDLWKSWRCYYLIWVDEKELGTKKQQINAFINNIKTRLESIEIKGDEK
jgi:hypothetical protein